MIEAWSNDRSNDEGFRVLGFMYDEVMIEAMMKGLGIRVYVWWSNDRSMKHLWVSLSSS